MDLEVFLVLLMAVSITTGLVVEGVKNVFIELGISYHANILAGCVAVTLAAAIGASYMILTEAAFNQRMAVVLIALMLLSWLSAMVGYDKVIQAITQITGKK